MPNTLNHQNRRRRLLLEVLVRAIREEKGKRQRDWKKDVKFTVSDNMILCIGNPKDPTPKTDRSNQQIWKVVEYKINKQKLAFLHTNGYLKNKQISPFTIASKSIKYGGINEAKAKDFYPENYC